METLTLIFIGLFAVLLVVSVAAVLLAVHAHGAGGAAQADAGAVSESEGAEDTAEARAAAVERSRELLHRLLQDVSTNVESCLGSVGEYDSTLASHSASVEEASSLGDLELVGRAILDEVAQMRATNSQYREQLEAANRTIEEQQGELRQLSVEAHTDFLTDVPNRRTLDQRIVAEFARFKRKGPRFSVVLIDLDHFKRVNDDHGHLAGDQVLVQVSALLRQCCREMDFLARYGGEEFAVILPDTGFEQAVDVAGRMREAVAGARVAAGPAQIGITVSAGVSEVLDSDGGVPAVLKRADEALYRAKGAGRNQVAHAH